MRNGNCSSPRRITIFTSLEGYDPWRRYVVKKRRERGEASHVFSNLLMGCLEALAGLVLVLAFVSSAHVAWYNANSQSRKKLTIDYTKVSATLSNSPVLVSFSFASDVAAFRDVCKNTWA
jgi:hypothetical protein